MYLKDVLTIVDEKNVGIDPAKKATEDQIVFDHTTGLDSLPDPIRVTLPLRDNPTENSDFPYRK